MVKEAFTFLRLSINIEQDVAFDEGEVQQEDEGLGETQWAATADPDSATRAGGLGAHLMNSPTTTPAKKKTKINVIRQVYGLHLK
jgi:hypothetical protein